MKMLAVVTAAAFMGGTTLTVPPVRAVAGITPVSYSEPAQLPARRIVVAIDLSKSNPLIDNAGFAAKVAQRVADQIRGLGFASEVHVRTFGNYDASSNNFHYDVTISIHHRPEDVAAEVEKLIAATPMLVKSGKWTAQGHTNILAFMDNVSQSIGCAGMPTQIILASDGVEDSEYVRLAKADTHLPPPQGKPFAGCAELQILGLGEGDNSPTQTVRIRGEWNGWAKAAGFSKFQGLNDW
ncbi:MAG TPA: hypothetical protein VHW02_12560 [Rhizomicrobium sp.]|jgi:hypothetical protein|nr:hypothetical protein [Rhizomicrobium sp.]